MKWLVWWKHMPMNLQVDETESWWNWKVSYMARWRNSTLIKPKVEKQQVNKMKSKWNDKLMKWQVGKTTSWWNDKLTKQLIDKMTS